ncbi:hypothetical protein SCHIN_v1c03370 [Spiroplasma chinense]|uniref:Uncharacterized protein n=1 Tax=Spiroplasma chinense TaxID=216932 RepID=A0A5B9Y3C8_9MOLU|nr:hypothetical protein [Spiroplasma chinense]QEH61534.1 hypothetical protein SCHIN_v1c03370 [Spiroplasma chinense]
MKKESLKKEVKILKEFKKRIKEIYVENKFLKISFKVNVFLFYIVALSVILQATVISNPIFNFVNIGFSAYILLNFTIIGWFSTEFYYKRLKVFEFDIELNKNKSSISRIIDLSSPSFIFHSILISFASVLIFVFQLLTTFEEITIVGEIGIIAIHLLLIPAFVRMFETILEVMDRMKKLMNHYLVSQFESMAYLFDDAKFDKNYTHLIFEEYNLVSRNSIFLVLAKHFSDEDKEEIKRINELILERYKHLWMVYTELYRLFRDQKNFENKRLMKLLRINLISFLYIWEDFFKF